MAEIFRCGNVAKLLENKYVVVMGDSVQRCIYKDMICAIQQDKYLADKDLRNKGERTLYKDELVEGGMLGQMTNGTCYREVRQFHTDYHLIRFYFITRCYNKYVQKVLADMKDLSVQPDVFIMNSCLWDISRYGANGVKEYQKNLSKLVEKLIEYLPKTSLVLWNCTLPISSTAKGGFIIPEVEALSSTLRLDIIHANNYARKVIMDAGFDVLDLHFYLRNHLHRRAGDGVHWDMTAHRRITNLIMTQIAEAWDIALPKNTNPEMVDPSILSLALEGQDDTSLHNKVVSDAIKARPKAKARRRRRSRAMANGNFDQPANLIVGGPYMQSPHSLPIRRPAANLPMMVDPIERYGGPVTPVGFTKIVQRSPAPVLSPFYNNQDQHFNNRSSMSRMLFNRMNPPISAMNDCAFMSPNNAINAQNLFPGDQCSTIGVRQTGGHSMGFGARVNSEASHALRFGLNGFSATMANPNSPMSIFSLNSQQSRLLALDGQRYTPGFSQF